MHKRRLSKRISQFNFVCVGQKKKYYSFFCIQTTNYYFYECVCVCVWIQKYKKSLLRNILYYTLVIYLCIKFCVSFKMDLYSKKRVLDNLEESVAKRPRFTGKMVNHQFLVFLRTYDIGGNDNQANFRVTNLVSPGNSRSNMWNRYRGNLIYLCLLNNCLFLAYIFSYILFYFSSINSIGGHSISMVFGKSSNGF